LISSGLLTQEQLDESLELSRAAGKPLGHTLVERGIVPAHSIAMALADQHGGPLKTEFGFAMGRLNHRPQEGVPAQPPSSPRILHLAPVLASQSPAVETVTSPPPVVDSLLDSAIAQPRDDETRTAELLARTVELQAELEAARHHAAKDVAALRREIEALSGGLEAAAGAEATLTMIRAELESARASESALRDRFAAEREARRKDAETVKAWRVQLDAALAQQAEYARVIEELGAQLETARARESAIPEALAAAAEKRTEDLLGELARAVDEQATSLTELDRLRTRVEELERQHEADSAAVMTAESAVATAGARMVAAVAESEELRDALAAERALTVEATTIVQDMQRRLTETQTQLEELQAGNESDVAARAATDKALELVENQLEAAKADAESAHAMLAAERAAHKEAGQTAEELRAQLEALETDMRESSMNAPLPGDIDELRAVIELQEQALAAAAARERADDGDPRVLISRPSTRSYSVDTHFLFAPGAAGYDFVERSGPSPAPGATVELSGGRICRVTRIGPAPLPGSSEACAYLEPA
jgi:chromosome segregation ATPase